MQTSRTTQWITVKVQCNIKVNVNNARIQQTAVNTVINAYSLAQIGIIKQNEFCVL